MSALVRTVFSASCNAADKSGDQLENSKTMGHGIVNCRCGRCHVIAPAAASATTLQVSATRESGASQYFCSKIITGGTAPYTVKWKPIANAYPVPPGAFHGSCTSPGVVEVLVKVVDAPGAVAKDTGTVACNAGSWP
jgi:hypothetical protein